MKILFAEDDALIASGLIYALESEGYEVSYCQDCKAALEAAWDEDLSLALLDLSLPDGSGFDVCRLIKRRLGIPVIFLTAADDEANTVKGLEIGADDYIAKPFRVRELLARIKVALRRAGQETGSPGIIKAGDIEVRVTEAKAYKSGEELFLTALEYRLLLTLICNKGQALTRGQILERLWDGGGEFVNDNTLTVNVKRLREKLGDNPGESLIQTVRGIGYRFKS
ncbi:MAG: response regulator transcription factor [Clostridiales bacterium]|jgi:DNA-binding response OmpR family regulator|nr:response regulator transcription factor [Clostridiales bacterium]